MKEDWRRLWRMAGLYVQRLGQHSKRKLARLDILADDRRQRRGQHA